MAASSWKPIAKRCADIFSLVRKRNPELIVNKYCTESTSSGLLDGVKILDLSRTQKGVIIMRFHCAKKAFQLDKSIYLSSYLPRVLAGPFCTMILGDLGADIIKVERPKVGDDTRGWGPPFTQSESVYFLSVNRNKRSITVNTKSVEGAEVIKQLACKSDVLVENFLPGKLAESGLGYDQLKEVAPHLIYCSLTGYGQTGPYRELGGYDVIAAGMGGLIHITGPEDGAPCRVGVAMTDLSTGLYAYGSIMAALLKRQKTGQGQHIDCNLLSTQVSILTHIGANYLTAGQEAKRYGTAHGSIVPYQAFPCADGHLIVGCGNDNHFKQLCKKMELDDLPTNPDYESNEKRVRNRKSLLDILFKRFAEKTKTEWISIFEGSTFPHGPINNMEQVFCDPQVLHNGMVQEIEHSTVGPIKVPGPAVKYSGSELKLRYPPPTLGQHTDEVLRDVLGYSTETIERLRRDKVI